jgi:hypothetical protein
VVLGRLGNTAHPSGESGQGGPHRKNELHGDVWSAEGDGGEGRRPGVVVGSSLCGEVVLSNAVLGV